MIKKEREILEYSYYKNGNIKLIKSNLKPDIKFSYKNGNLVRYGNTIFEYDDYDNLIYMKEDNDRQHWFYYDISTFAEHSKNKKTYKSKKTRPYAFMDYKFTYYMNTYENNVIEKKYNENGDLIFICHYSLNRINDKYITEIKYDENNNKIKEIYYNKEYIDDKIEIDIIEELIFEYDENNKLIKCSNFNESRDESLIFYDENGNIIKRIFNDMIINTNKKDLNTKNILLLNYDENNNLINSLFKSSDSEEFIEYEICEYNDFNQLIYHKEYKDRVELFEYDKNNNIIFYQLKDSISNYKEEKHYEYNDNNQLICEIIDIEY